MFSSSDLFFFKLPGSSILRVWSGTKKYSLLEFDIVQFVMPCINSMSDSLHFFFLLMGVGLLRVKEIKNDECLFTHLFGLLIGVVLAPIRVTTLVSIRYSVLWVWSQRKTHCSDSPRTWSIQRCPPLLHPALLPSLHQKKTRFFR